MECCCNVAKHISIDIEIDFEIVTFDEKEHNFHVKFQQTIIYIEDNFKLVFLIIEDTVRESINILNYKQSMKLFAFLCNFQKLLFSV